MTKHTRTFSDRHGPSQSPDVPGDFPGELISIDDVYLDKVDGIWLFGP